MQMQIIEEMKSFIGFGAEDAANLKSLGPVMAPHQGKITDTFYETLGRHGHTALLIEGRVEQLKQTHAKWFGELFGGEYGEAYFVGRWKIGLAHVRIGLDPFWVEAVMSVIRTMAAEALATTNSDAADAARKYGSLCKLLDLDLLVINLSYQDDRLTRLTDFTGMKRTLIENIIRLPKK
jgi:hypothetical protein